MKNDLSFMEHYDRFARLYPHLHLIVRAQDDSGNFFQSPRIGYIDDGEFVSHGCALSPVDAVLIQCLNFRHENAGIVGHASAMDDLNAALSHLQALAHIGEGDNAGIFFSGEYATLDADEFWRESSLDVRRHTLISYLTFESMSDHGSKS